MSPSALPIAPNEARRRLRSVLELDGAMMNVSGEAVRIIAEYSSSEMTRPELEDAIADTLECAISPSG